MRALAALARVGAAAHTQAHSSARPPGGGSCEAALNIYLENFATTLGSREQLAIAEFADALLVIPKTLAVNAAKDATELVAKLRAYHYTAQTKPDKAHMSQVQWQGGAGRERGARQGVASHPPHRAAPPP